LANSPRLPYYNRFVRNKLQLPALPIVFYLTVEMDGIRVDRCVDELGGLEINRFQFL
jgi:hypothetical protein